MGAGTAGVSGVPNGPANAGGLNNSGNDHSGADNSAKAPTAPGTYILGTANSSGSPGAAVGGANGSTPGPSMPGDAESRSEDPKVDAKIKNICKGC
jgi:hypothetical protein